MAPNKSNLLLYENEDVERVSTFEKKGKFCVGSGLNALYFFYTSFQDFEVDSLVVH